MNKTKDLNYTNNKILTIIYYSEVPKIEIGLGVCLYRPRKIILTFS